MKRKLLTISVTVWVMVTVFGLVTLLSTETKLYAVECWGCPNDGDCSMDALTCIPYERDWEAYGTELFTAWCLLGHGGYPSCREVPTGDWCMKWYDCTPSCSSCTFNEEESHPVNSCILGG